MHELVMNKLFKISSTIFSAAEKKNPRRMDFSNTTRSKVIHFLVTSIIISGICECLNFMVEQAMTATKRNSRIEVTELISTALDEKISNSAPTELVKTQRTLLK